MIFVNVEYNIILKRRYKKNLKKYSDIEKHGTATTPFVFSI